MSYAKRNLTVNVEEPPNHSNNYYLPLDSPTSPRPNSTVEAVALILDKIIQSNEHYLLTYNVYKLSYKYPKLINAFSYNYQHEITYERLRKVIFNFCYRTRMRNEALVGAILYLDRIVYKSNIVIAKSNCILVLACTLLIVQKMYDDFHYSVKDYSMLFNIPSQVLAKAEHAYLKLIRYDLVIGPEEYNQYRDYIVYRYDATLRQAFPMSGNASILKEFVMPQGLASVRDVGTMLYSLQGTKGGKKELAQDAPEENQMNEIRVEVKVVEDMMKTDMKLDDTDRAAGDIGSISLPGNKFM